MYYDAEENEVWDKEQEVEFGVGSAQVSDTGHRQEGYTDDDHEEEQ